MKYIPTLMGLDGELNALKNQNFGNNIIPFIQIIKDIKIQNGTASIINDIDSIIASKPQVDFFVTVPRNLNLSSKKIKGTVETFFANVNKINNYHADILNKLCKHSNVIPVIEVNLENYNLGDLTKLKNSIASGVSKYCYRIEAKSLDIIKTELFSLINKQDFIIYDLNDFSFDKTSIKKEIKEIHAEKLKKGFKTIAIKQIYKDLTFFKFPDGLIKSHTDAYDCIDFDFYDDFKIHNFDYFGDWAGIRNNPIYGGGASYPAYLTIEMDNFNHHGFRGIEKDVNSYTSSVLSKYIKSDHWNNKLTPLHKNSCYGCKMINGFILKKESANSATKWKTVSVSHFIETMDFKIKNSLI